MVSRRIDTPQTMSEAARCGNTVGRFSSARESTHEGTSMESINGLIDAARKHLELLRSDHAKQDAQDRRYVRLAYMYGVEPDEIAASTGFSLARIQGILGGAE